MAELLAYATMQDVLLLCFADNGSQRTGIVGAPNET